MCQGRTYLKGIMSNGVSANTKGKVFTFLCKCWLTTWGLIVQTFISYSVQLRCSHNILHQNTRCEQALQNAPPTSLFIVCFFFFAPPHENEGGDGGFLKLLWDGCFMYKILFCFPGMEQFIIYI